MEQALTLAREDTTIDVEERVSVAGQWLLVWWRFRKHKLALASVVIVVLLYMGAVCADFMATAEAETTDAFRSLMPPQRLYLFDEGRFSPYVFPFKSERDPATMLRVYRSDLSRKLPVALFAPGFKYKLLGFIPANRHLLVIQSDDPQDVISLLGTDVMGRDVWTRLFYASRISLSIGVFSVLLSFVLGLILGGISGFFGGPVDTLIQRLIEVVRAIPSIPLWMALTASLPRTWSVAQVYLTITIILSFIGWTDLARVIRGRFLSVRSEDFVTAARLAGCGRGRIIFRHIMPSFSSHIIASLTLAVPAMIMSETALSFLGLGLRAPAISWGIMLQQAINLQTVAFAPWLLMPGVPILISILGFNFMGDGLRDAADPYGA